MDMLTIRKEAKSLPSDTFPGLKKTIKITFAAGALPRTPPGELTALPRPCSYTFKDRFAAGRGKGREKGRGREEKGGIGKDPQKVRWICQLGGKLAPSLLGGEGIDAPANRQ